MTCEQAQAMMPEHWALLLEGADELALEAHLADCATCRAEEARLRPLWQDLDRVPAEEPSPRLRTRFYESLHAYREGESRKAGRSWFSAGWSPQAAAAAVLIAIGLGAGYALHPSTDATQMQQLREEVATMRQMVVLSLMQQQSASDRLRGVSWANRAGTSNTEVLSALVTAMTEDADVNVRLAAVDALHAFAASPVTRQAVVDALPRQDAPLVQVALIDLLVDLKERQAIKSLQRLASDGSIDAGVKQRALWAITKLDDSQSPKEQLPAKEQLQ